MNGNQFKRLRNLIGMTQEEISNSLCMERRSIIYMEKGKRSVTAKTEKLIKLLWFKQYQLIMECEK